MPKNEENNDLIMKIFSKVEDNNKYLKQILDLCVSLILKFLIFIYKFNENFISRQKST